MRRILENVKKHYDNGIELDFDSLYRLLRSLQERMEQNAAGVDVSAKWFFDRYSPITNIKAVGHADVTYGMAVNKENITRKEITRSEEHTSELQSRFDLVCRLLLEKKKKIY